MNYNKHLNLEGKHAFLGASKSSWLNKSDEQLISSYARGYIASIGTALHDIARKHIKHNFKLNKSSKREIFLSLIEDYYIPGKVLDIAIDYDMVFDNMMNYVNESIAYRMVPEQILYYSDDCFGTADAISQLDMVFKHKILRINDLKTGTTPVHIEQLLVYASLFLLEYNTKPHEIDIELRIYQNNEIIEHKPEADEIVPIMNRIITADKLLREVKEA